MTQATPKLALTSNQLFIPSPNLMISCGCVAIDLRARKIAILRDTSPASADTSHDPTTPLYQLPKGRKNINESHHETAIRETFEETGIAVAPLPLRIATRAVPSKEMLEELGPNPEGVDVMGVSDGIISTEPSAVCAYQCRSTLAYKLVYWYAAQGDSTIQPASDTKDPWESHLQMEWVDAHKAASYMTDEVDGQVIQKVLSDVRNTGYDI